MSLMKVRPERARGWALWLCILALLSGCAEDAPVDNDDEQEEEEEEDDSSNADDDDDSDDDAPRRDAGNGKTDGGGSNRDGGRADAGSGGKGGTDASAAAKDAAQSSRLDATAMSGGDEPDSGGSEPEDDAGQNPRADASQPSDDDAGSAGMPEDLGVGDGKDVITIGDSWMLLRAGTGTTSNGIGIEVSLEKASKRDYRNFGVPGTKLLDDVIPNQYASAKRQDPNIKTVIMTGGGNDIIQTKPTDCVDSAFGDVCKAQIDMVAARLVTLWEEMKKDGVRDVVMVGYTKKAYLLVRSSTLSKSAEYSNQKIPPLCAAVTAPLRCHAVDSDMVFDGATREGIHPTDAGYDAIGKAVWELMQTKGMRR